MRSHYSQGSGVFELLDTMLPKMIDSAANMNPSRDAYCAIMEVNRYNNPDYNDMLDTLYDLVEQENEGRRQQRMGELTDREIETIATSWLEMDVAALTLSDDRLLREVPRDRIRDLEDLAARREQWIRRVSRPSGRSDYRRAGAVPGAHIADNSARSARQPIRASNPRLRGGGSDVTQGMRTAGRFMTAENAAGAPQAPVEDTPRVRTRFNMSNAPTEATPTPTAAPAADKREPDLNAIHEGPDYTSARPYDLFQRSGEVWKPAHLSTWVIKGQIFPRLYDPNTAILFHVYTPSTKVVREEFITMNPELEYLRNELLRPEDRRDVAKTRRHNPVLDKLRNRKTDSDAPVVQEHPAAVIQKTHQTIKERPMDIQIKEINNLTEGGSYIRALHLCGERTPIRHYVRMVRILVPKERSTDLSALSRNPSGFASDLKRLRPDIDRELWNYLNRRMTEVTNQKLVESLPPATRARLNSFADDFQDACAALEKTYGNQFVASFIRSLRDVVEELTADQDYADNLAAVCAELELDRVPMESMQAYEFGVITTMSYLDQDAVVAVPGVSDKYQSLSAAQHSDLTEYLSTLLGIRDAQGIHEPLVVVCRCGGHLQVVRDINGANIAVRLMA